MPYDTVPYEGYKTITVKEDLVMELQRKWKKDRQNKFRSFGSYVSELLWYEIERNSLLKTYAPFLERVGAGEDTIFIKDHKMNRIADITIKNAKLYCNICKTDYCVHSAFASGMPELIRLVYRRDKVETTDKDESG